MVRKETEQERTARIERACAAFNKLTIAQCREISAKLGALANGV